jgi:hypothetical protein
MGLLVTRRSGTHMTLVMLDVPATTPELVQTFPSVTHRAFGTQVILSFVLAWIIRHTRKSDGKRLGSQLCDYLDVSEYRFVCSGALSVQEPTASQYPRPLIYRVSIVKITVTPLEAAYPCTQSGHTWRQVLVV